MRNITVTLILPKEEEINDAYERLNSITSSKRLLAIGKEYAKERRYEDASLFFNKASFDLGILGEIANRYEFIVNSIEGYSSPDRDLTLGKLFGERRDNMVIERLIHHMRKSIDMHFQRELPKEDLLEIETLINRLPLNEIKSPKKDEFREVYNAFEIYCAEVLAQD
jgi:hypothetical protein